MELRVLRYFLTVVQEENITRAAELLHITQPTLSRQLQQLEEEIGVALFVRERGTRKITLTAQGFLLRRRAEEILDLVDKTESELVETEALINGSISIGCGEMQAVELLAKIIAAFKEEYPLVHFDLYTANADSIKERMEKGLIDIGLVLEPVNMDKFEFLRFPILERWVVVMPAGDSLASLKEIHMSDLKGLPIITVKRSSVLNELANWFQDGFSELTIAFTSNMSTNAAILVQNHLGYALVVEGSLPFWDQTKITYRPLVPELHTSTLLAYRRQQLFSPATERFIRFTKCFLGINKAE